MADFWVFIDGGLLQYWFSPQDDVTPEMLERHALERDALSAECDADAASLERDMLAAMHDEYDDSLKQLHRDVIAKVCCLTIY